MCAVAEDQATPRVVGALDIGSNAIRMVLAQIDAQGCVEAIEDLQRAVPLGQDAFTTRHIEPETINLAIEVIRGFQRIMEPYRVDHLRAVATSAVREALNQDLFLERVFMSTGISVEVVTSSEEHRLLYAAVRNAFGEGDLHSSALSLIVELGSGTSDLSMFQAGRVVYAGSYSLGTIRLRNSVRMAQNSPSQAVSLIKRLITPAVDVMEQSSPLSDVHHFIGIGAELRFASEHVGKSHDDRPRIRTIPRKDFLRFTESVSRLRPEELSRRYALPYEDAETIAPALLTYAEMLRRTPASVVSVPFVSMRDGMILDFVAEQTGEGLDELERQIFSSAEALGQHFQYDEDHSQHVADLACDFFDQLKSLHRLERRERRLLRVAAILHDIGNYVSARAHHKHTQYLISNSDIFGLHARDRDQVACVARYHRRAHPKPTHIEYNQLLRHDRATVAKLAAILRVADALDCGHARKVQSARIELRKGEAILHIESHEDLALERLAMRVKGGLFEEVFGLKVIIQN